MEPRRARSKQVPFYRRLESQVHFKGVDFKAEHPELPNFPWDLFVLGDSVSSL